MTLRHLKIFAAVCDAGSVTRAAAELYMTQPAVSIAIAELEKHYGLSLIHIWKVPNKVGFCHILKKIFYYCQHLKALMRSTTCESFLLSYI